MEKTRQRAVSDDAWIKYIVNNIIRQMSVAFAGFVASCASFDGLCPFGTAFAASIIPEYIPSAILGAAAGSFFVYGVNVLTLRYIASVAVAGILSYILKSNLRRKYHIYFSTLSAFLAVLPSSFSMKPTRMLYFFIILKICLMNRRIKGMGIILPT